MCASCGSEGRLAAATLGTPAGCCCSASSFEPLDRSVGISASCSSEFRAVEVARSSLDQLDSSVCIRISCGSEDRVVDAGVGAESSAQPPSRGRRGAARASAKRGASCEAAAGICT